MFEGGLKENTKDIAANLKLANISLMELAKNLKASITDVSTVIEFASAINTKAANAVRESIGQTRAISNDVQKVVAQAAKQTMQIGVSAEKNIELFAAINTAMLRNTYFSEQQIVRFQQLGVNANMTSAQLAQMATSFDTLGYSTDQALSTMEDMTKEARSYGVNVSSFMGKINDNLKLMVTYNFKDGVKGLSKMVAQAQALRIDMSKTVAFGDSLLDPSKAIETAASFQMLGGSVGALGDPFQLLHMAQTDMEGLQTSLIDMAAGAVSFNKESGEFDIPITEMYRLREAAKLAGYGYQEFSEMAMNAAQRTEKIKMLDQFNTVPEEHKELIASMGKIGANGNLEITLPNGVTRTIGEGFNNLVAEDYATLKKSLDTNKMSEMEVAKTSMGYLNQIQAAQQTLVKLTTLNLAKSDGFEKSSESMVKNQNMVTTSVMDREQEIKLPTKIVDAIMTLETQLKLTKEQANQMADGVVVGLGKAGEAIDGLVTSIENADFAGVILDKFKDGWDAILDLDFTGLEIMGKNLFITEIERNNKSSSTPNPTTTQRNTTPKPVNGSTISTVERQNLSSSQSNNNSQSTSQVAEVTVNGTVNLTLDSLATGLDISKDLIAEKLRNNPVAMMNIKKQLDNSLNAYGNDWQGTPP